MKTGFLYRVAEKYLNEYGDRLREVCFVFPSVRSSLFFQKYIGQISGKALFAPTVTTIDNLFASLSPYRKGDRIELLHILYLNYKRLSHSELEFDDFLNLGEVLLSDFSDIDKYPVDAEKIFANISDLRSLDSDYSFLSERQLLAIRRFWEIFTDGESQKKTEFKKTWKILYPLYSDFKKELSEKGIAYSGMSYREVVERFDTESVECGYNRVVFIGQNALCECELKLLDYARKNWDGDFYWDFYGDMVTDPHNKSSMFIKGYIGRYPSKYKVDGISDSRPEIEVVSVSSAIGQAKAAGEILKNLDGNGTAVVLPDDALLMPLLNSIPDNIKDINVTMGYPLSNSAFASFMNMLASMQTNKRNKRGKSVFSHRDIMAILSHSFMALIDKQGSKSAVNTIVKENILYISCDDPLLTNLDADIFRAVESVPQAVEWQIAVIEKLYEKVSPIEREFAYGYLKAVNKLKDLNVEMRLTTYFRFLRMLSGSIPVSFRGEPLTGLQIMGPLETRSIDFENLIILSVNEGVYPAKTKNDSFIPYNLRYGFGLPVTENLDSVSAYHFYRGIYRAKKVFLIYDSRTAGMKSGEESRFIKQLKYHYQAPLVEKVCTFKVTPATIEQATIEKDIEKIPRVFSASSINTYIDCPLMFYYEKVLNIKDEVTVEENIEADMFGKIFHSVMELLYTGKSEITKELIEAMDTSENVRARINEAMIENLKSEKSVRSGQWKIVSAIIEEFVHKTLSEDKKRTPFTYIASEEKIYHKVSDLYSFVCIVDRIDKKDGQYRICDYKTGTAHEVNLNGKTDVMAKIFDPNQNERANTTLQMLLYAWVVSEKRGIANTQLSVYKMRDIYEEGVTVQDCPTEILETFKENLRNLIENEILNPDIPFEPRPNDKRCKYCHVRPLCGL